MEDNGIYRIAGVVSAGGRFPDTDDDKNADVDDQLNATWGQFGRDTRIAVPDNLNFVLSTIPEPSTAVMLFIGLGLVTIRHQRRR